MYVLAYDSDCGPCTKFRNAVQFLDTRGRLRYVGLAQAESDGLLDMVPPSRRHRSFHLVAPSGASKSGAEALAPLASLLPGGAAFSFIVGSNPLAYKAAAFVYGAFARLHDAGSCGYRPAGDRVNGTIDLDIKVDVAPSVPSGPRF